MTGQNWRPLRFWDPLWAVGAAAMHGVHCGTPPAACPTTKKRSPRPRRCAGLTPCRPPWCMCRWRTSQSRPGTSHAPRTRCPDCPRSSPPLGRRSWEVRAGRVACGGVWRDVGGSGHRPASRPPIAEPPHRLALTAHWQQLRSSSAAAASPRRAAPRSGRARAVPPARQWAQLRCALRSRPRRFYATSSDSRGSEIGRTLLPQIAEAERELGMLARSTLWPAQLRCWKPQHAARALATPLVSCASPAAQRLRAAGTGGGGVRRARPCCRCVRRPGKGVPFRGSTAINLANPHLTGPYRQRSPWTQRRVSSDGRRPWQGRQPPTRPTPKRPSSSPPPQRRRRKRRQN
jgi:hypothetical protein